ncbi:MAG: M1 family metallopeptidase [Sphingomonadaceae bacterium]
MARLLSLVAALLALIATPALADAPPGELPDVARPLAYRIDLEVDPAEPRFRGTTEIDIELKAPATRLFLHGNGLSMDRAEALTGRMAPNRARYAELDPTGVAELLFERPLQPGRHRLRFRYSAPFMESVAGLYRAEVQGRWYAWTQFQAIDARRVFPGFDEPRHKTDFTISITTPAGLKAFANGADAGQDRLPDGRVRHRFQPIGPMPTYLVALAVGDFDVAEAVIPPNAVRREPLPFRVIATKGQKGRMGVTLKETPGLLARLEAWFGRPHPWPKLDVIASPTHGGAMENNGLIVFDDTGLLLDDDAPPGQLRGFGIVMAHELAHQWFGNAVTPRWWDDIWLNESFAEWMGNEIAEAWRPDLGTRVVQIAGALEAMREDSLAQGRPIRQPITRNADINSAFDSITYQKGNQVVRMMEGFVGADAFQRAVRLHLDRHWNGTATSDDFFRSMADGTGEAQLVPAFRSFVDQQGVPLVSFGLSSLRGQAIAQTRFVPVGVTVPGETRWTVPVCASSGEGRSCALLAEASGVMPAVIGTAPWLHGNSEGRGYYRFDLPADGWARLVAAGATLPAPEALTAVDSLWAGFEAGRRPFAALLPAARAFAAHEERLVSTWLPGQMVDFAGRAGTPADQGALEALVRELAAPRLKALGVSPARGAWAADGAERRQLRQLWTSYAVLDGRDPGLSARMAEAARRWLDGDTQALDPAYRVIALRAALRADPALAGPLFERAAQSDDPLFRRQGFAALGAEAPDSLLDRLFDTRLQAIDPVVILGQRMGAPRHRAAAFAWLEANLDRLKPKLGGLLGQFTAITGSLCTEADAARVDALFRPRMADMGLGELDVARPVAAIRQCVAQKARLRPDMARALAAAR